MNGIHEALAEAGNRVGAIGKTERNKEQGFMFRSIEAIVAAAKPVFAELGVSVTPRVLEKDYQEVTARSGTKGWRCTITVEYTFAHIDGSSVVSSMAGEAIDYGDKSTTKAAQMAYKYALIQVLLIGGDDPDAESHDIGETREAKEQTPWEWVWTESAIFKAWSKDERLAAANLAMTSHALGEPTTMDEAKVVLEHMRNQYETRTEPLPLDEES